MMNVSIANVTSLREMHQSMSNLFRAEAMVVATAPRATERGVGTKARLLALSFAIRLSLWRYRTIGSALNLN